MSAASAMIAHRYGLAAMPSTPAAPHRGAPPKATITPKPSPPPLTGRELQARRAALELKQVLDNSGVPHKIKKLSRGGTPTSYTFSFDLPLEAAIQQFATQANQIAARHGTGVGFLASFLGTTPRAVLVIANDPVLAHIAFKTGLGSE